MHKELSVKSADLSLLSIPAFWPMAMATAMLATPGFIREQYVAGVPQKMMDSAELRILARAIAGIGAIIKERENSKLRTTTDWERSR